MMRSLLDKKPWVILLSVLALGALTVLAVSVEQVPFGEAQPIGREEAQSTERPPQPLLSGAGAQDLFSRIALAVSLVILVVMVGMLLTKEGRKRLIRFLLRLAITLWGLYYLVTRHPEVFNFLLPPPPAVAPASPSLDSGANIPPPVFTPPAETPLLSYAIGLLLVLGAIFLGWRLYLAWRAVSLRPATSLKDLARIARASLRDLGNGRETTDVIMNCYFRMSDVVADKRNLQRGLSMTPLEFASRLEEAGLPADAVRRLTRLFEGVRYGGRKAGPKDVNEAVACLTSILHYCGETA